MSSPEPSETLSTDHIEDRFLALLQNRPFPVAELLEMLVVLHSCGQTQRRDDCVLVLQETFADEGDREGLIRLFELRSDWCGNRPSTGLDFRDLLARAMKDRLGQAQLDSVGFGALPPRESLRRLQVLLACRPGTFCLDKTWGFGIVNSVDDFYRRMVVDFHRRTGHAMTFAYAGEVLKLLDAQHLLAIRHADPAGFDAQLREDPADAVRMAIRSLGPMSVVRLEEEFRVHGLLPRDMEWKRFWSTARSALKQDPLVRVPPATRKSEPIELLTKAVALGDAEWFAKLARQRDVGRLLSLIASLENAKAPPQLDDSARAILADRLEFVFRATETSRKPAAKVKAIILAVGFGLDAIDRTAWLACIRNPEFVASASAKLPVREIERMLTLIPVATDLSVALPFVDSIAGMPYALVDGLLPVLLRGVAAEETRKAIREEFTAGEVPPALLLWLTRRQSDPEVQSLVGASAVCTQCLAALDMAETGERLRIQHQIARRFEDFAWLEGMLAHMDDVEQQALYERIHACEDGWEPPTKRSILGQMLKWHPELSERRAAATRGGLEPAVPRLTSWRSYGERLEQHRKLVEEDLPANSHDIAVARSYGDLRENFEYQAAKDAQRLLLERQAELDAEIKRVKGTDFAGMATDRAGMGTAVTVRASDGSSPRRYAILGEWDSDESRGIVSNRSRVAEALEGHVAGEVVTLPSAAGPEDVRIVAVEPLPTEVLDWAMGRG